MGKAKYLPFMTILITLGLLGAFVPAATASKLQRPFDHAHAKWTTLLREHLRVTGPQSTFDYAGLKAKNQTLLNNYLADLSRVSPQEFDTFSRSEQMAFLINAYNAFTVKLIVDHYPVTSIKKIGGLFSSPWKKKFFQLLGTEQHLDHIEHEILRKKYPEPRIHFAVNCASIGCPALRHEAYEAKKLDEQLNEQARLFLRDSSRNRIDSKKQIVELSKIFDWFKEDFTKNGQTVAAYVAPYMTDDPKLQEALKSGKYRVKFLSYDWDLNKTP